MPVPRIDRWHLTLLDPILLRDWQGPRDGWAAAARVLLNHLVPTNAHSDIGFARVVFPEGSHSVSLVNIVADLQASRLLQQPADQMRNVTTDSLLSPNPSYYQFYQAASQGLHHHLVILPLPRHTGQ